MNKIVLVCVVAMVTMSVINFNSNKKIEEYEPNKVINTADIIKINEIQNMASAKIMAESKLIEKEDLPKEIVKLTNVVGNEASMITALYTKSDYTKEEFDVMHDYVFHFFNDKNNQSIKISATKEEKTLRDYFFQATEDISIINGYDMKISRYEERYMINFVKGEYHYDVETSGLTEEEMIKVIKDILI